MTKPNRLPLTRAIFAASLALTATIASFTATASPAQAAAPRNAYSAGLVTPLAAPRREIIGG